MFPDNAWHQVLTLGDCQNIAWNYSKHLKTSIVEVHHILSIKMSGYSIEIDIERCVQDSIKMFQSTPKSVAARQHDKEHVSLSTEKQKGSTNTKNKMVNINPGWGLICTRSNFTLGWNICFFHLSSQMELIKKLREYYSMRVENYAQWNWSLVLLDSPRRETR